jgi:putative transposase
MGRTSSAVYNISYHIVWCSKYRKAILTGEVKQFLEEQLETIAETKEYKILEMRVMPDHIHLFIEAKPFDAPTNIVKIFKGVTSLRLFKRFPKLHKQLWRGVLCYGVLHTTLELQVMSLLKPLSDISVSRNGIHPLVETRGLLSLKLIKIEWTFYMSMSPIPPMPLGPLPGLGVSLGFDAAITSSIRSIMHAASVAAFITCSLTASGS